MGDLRLACTHLSWRPDESATRLRQVRALYDDAAQNGWLAENQRFILAGDFNAIAAEPAIRHLTERMADTFGTTHPGEAGETFIPENPLVEYAATVGRIDYIFADRAACIEVAEVVAKGSDPVSDHYGLLAQLAWDA